MENTTEIINQKFPLELIETVLDRNRITKPNLFRFRTIKEDLEKEGFSFKGNDEEIEGYIFQGENGLKLILYPVLFFPRPDYFHLLNFNLYY